MLKTIVLFFIALVTIRANTVLDEQQYRRQNVDDFDTYSEEAFQNSDICGQVGHSVNTRIINGIYASNCQFPWMVSIVVNNDPYSNKRCGGTIIDEKHILSAAHCFVKYNKRTGVLTFLHESRFLVISGSSYIPNAIPPGSAFKKRTIARINIHKKYTINMGAYDIAILELTDPIFFDECHKPLCLIDGQKPPEEATNCLVMGWGQTSNHYATTSENLKYTEVTMVPDRVCWDVYGIAIYNVFCAGLHGLNSCYGDSGGPLACREPDGKYYIYGIVSGGVVEECAGMTLYTSVLSFLVWIQSNIM